MRNNSFAEPGLLSPSFIVFHATSLLYLCFEGTHWTSEFFVAYRCVKSTLPLWRSSEVSQQRHAEIQGRTYQRLLQVL